MVYFLTSVFVVLAHGQQAPAHAPVRFGMTMPEVFHAFGEDYHFPERALSYHRREMVDWLGGEEWWTVWYDDRLTAVAWERKYRPLAYPPEWLWPVVHALGLRERLVDFFPPTRRETEKGWQYSPWRP